MVCLFTEQSIRDYQSLHHFDDLLEYRTSNTRHGKYHRSRNQYRTYQI